MVAQVQKLPQQSENVIKPGLSEQQMSTFVTLRSAFIEQIDLLDNVSTRVHGILSMQMVLRGSLAIVVVIRGGLGRRGCFNCISRAISSYLALLTLFQCVGKALQITHIDREHLVQ